MEITVGMGEIRVAKALDLLIAIGLGSCVAVAVYDKETKTGGLAHIVLPYIREAQDQSHPNRFSDIAIDEMIEQMKNQGARIRDLKAKIFGGANMFPELISSASTMDVGKRNILTVRDELKRHNIPIIAEDVGDHVGRTVIFDTRDGSVVVKTAHAEASRY